jgi:multidrug efflux pump subunit AcrA (membrane-fusion protein)
VSIARKWIFPIAWIVIVGVIAAALVKIAFFPDQSSSARPEEPSVEIVDPQYTVALGTVRNDVVLSGTVGADAAIPIPATLSGEVREVSVSKGQQVSAGQEILKLRATVVNEDGTTSTDWDVVTAPASGILSSFTALVGQSFAVGDPVGQIAPPSFHVSGSIPPEQLYRLLSKPTDAEVTITGGPAPFTCTGLTITTPLPGEGSGSGSTGDGTGGPTISCAIPAEITVFAGLQAQIVIAGGIAENVLVIPTTAVEGVAETGNVYLVLADGSTEVRPVTLGLNDGVMVQVVDGLDEGDVILQFVPGAPSVPTDGGFIDPGVSTACIVQPDGSTICKG